MNLFNKKKISVGLIISILVIILFFYIVDSSELLVALKKISLFTFILGFTLYMTSNIIRAIRLRYIFKKTSFIKTIYIAFIHNFWNNLLPAKLGELSLIYLFKKEKENTSRILSSIILLRVYDVVIFLIIIAFSIKINFDYFNWIMISILFILICYLFFGYRVVWFLYSKKTKNKVINKIISFLYHNLDKISFKKNLEMIFYSFSIWFINYAVIFIIVRDIIEIDMKHIILGINGVIVSSFIPIQGISGIGTMEGSWVGVLSIFNYDLEKLIISGIVLHIIIILYYSVLGILAIIIKTVYQRYKKNIQK